MNSSESTKQNVLRKNTKEKPGILGLLLDKKKTTRWPSFLILYIRVDDEIKLIFLFLQQVGNV